MAQSRASRVASFAFYSRILVLLMQVFFNCLMPDHDARVFNPPRPDKESGYDNFVQILLEGLRRWDGIYFMHIAEHGYTYENTVVFFPFYPLLVRLIANTVLFPLQYILNYPNVLLIGGTLINLVAFVYAAKALYHLGCRVLEDEPMAFRAAQLFCINPASIFFSATYSESCFALLSFSGMLAIELNQTLRSAVFFGLCGLTRSNGILCLGYILYRKFRKGLSDFETIVRSNVGLLNTAIKISLHGFHFLLTEVFPGLFVCLLPFVSFQVYCYSIYCGIFKSNVSQIPRGIIDYGNQIKYRMPHQGFSVWCYNKIPLSYTYVQHHHWDVGFLKYYEWRQLPNFIAASPMAFLCLAAIIIYVSKNMIYSISLGLCEPEDSHYKKQEDPTDEQRTKNQGFFSPRCYPYIVHMIVLLISGIFFMHIQVITRIIASACPVFYWFVAHLTFPKEKPSQGTSGNSYTDQNGFNPIQHSYLYQYNILQPNRNNPLEKDSDILEWDNQTWVKKFIMTYFHLYLFVGTAAFSNFLPWT